MAGAFSRPARYDAGCPPEPHAFDIPPSITLMHREIPRACRLLLGLAILLLATATTMESSATCRAAEASMEPIQVASSASALVEQHCIRCHGPKKAEHGLRLDGLSRDVTRPPIFAAWERVLRQLRESTMPPEGEPRPDAAALASAEKEIAAALDAVVARRRAEGRTTLRRLNRIEYENTVRDLFDVDVAVKEILPEDTIAQGFDNIGAALNVSPVLMERYLEAADAVLTAAIAPRVPGERMQKRYNLYDSLPSWFATSTYKRDDGVVLFRSDASATALFKFAAKTPGLYRFKISAYGYQSDVPVPYVVLAGNFRTAGSGAKIVGYYDAPPRKPGVVDITVRLEQRNATIKVAPSDLPKVYLKQDKMPDYTGPGLNVNWIEVDGPLPEDAVTPSYRRLYGDVDPKRGTLDDARAILARLLPRAFRRPTTDEELAPYVTLAAAGLEKGATFEQSLHGAIKAVLCAPDFLYFDETPGPLKPYALASRLSYFLWSTMPDEELLAVAGRGDLTKPEMLRAQVERMLEHPKSEAFTKNFTGQWLSLREIDATTPDVQLYPEFDELLKWSMVAESQAFFNELLHNDLSLLNFLDSDFAMINARLAKLYGIDGVEGVAIRRVPLRPEHGRGGVLTQAAVLKVTANGTTTSPVVRGVWVLDHILGEAAAPPPPNVPAIEPDIRGAVTIREQLAKHRATPACASCHVRIDPPGFALENYDVIGGRRERYRALGVKPRPVEGLPPEVARIAAKPRWGDGLPVDAGDELPDGRKFADAAEFKKLLLAEPEKFTRCLTKKLVTYATGNPVEYGDHSEVERIVAAVKDKKYGLRTLVHEIVASELFRNK
jgi:mono/diheme cytochrome c family protein